MSQSVSLLIRKKLPGNYQIVEDMDGLNGVKICFGQEQQPENFEGVPAIVHDALNTHGYRVFVVEETHGAGTEIVLVAKRTKPSTEKETN